MTRLWRIITLLCIPISTTTGNTSLPRNAYQKYTRYHEYCSTPEQQDARSIPPLSTTTPLLSTPGVTVKLQQLTTVIRHGQRTPYAAHDCWPGYWDESSDTSSWNCDLDTLTSPPGSSAISLEHLRPTDDGTSGSLSEQIDDLSGQGQQFLFVKKFDAFYAHRPSHFPSNLQGELRGGTCQVGQLLLEGYDQELKNGLLLRNTYVKDLERGVNPTKDSNHVLFDFDPSKDGINELNKRVYEEPQIFFRSDDDQRTMMSGQVLLHGLFAALLKAHTYQANVEFGLVNRNPVVRVHTSERNKDTLSPNHEGCPRLTELEKEAKESQLYRDFFVNSAEAIQLENFRDDKLGGSHRMEDEGVCVDCLMTTMCTDRDLPAVLDDYNAETPPEDEGYGVDFFHRLTNIATHKKIFKYQYNHAAYSKLAMTPLWSSILMNLLHFTKVSEDVLLEDNPGLRTPPPKFALYSAHDSTIMGLLASLNILDSVETTVNEYHWPPYASMLLIELYEMDIPASSSHKTDYPSEHGFRLIYNGQVMTNSISGCPEEEEICDITVLTIHVSPFANVTKYEEECQPTTTPNPTSSPVQSPYVSPFPDPQNPTAAEKRPENKTTRGIGEFSAFVLVILSSVLSAMLMHIYMSRQMNDLRSRHRIIDSALTDELSRNGGDGGKDEEEEVGSSRVYGIPSSGARSSGVIPSSDSDLSEGSLPEII